jgi:hypothetical protein
VNTLKINALAAAALLAFSPAAALAQDYNNTTDTQYVQTEEEDNDFPWGLLGLLGLAGLMGGRKKGERDIHVDARQDKR